MAKEIRIFPEEDSFPMDQLKRILELKDDATNIQWKLLFITCVGENALAFEDAVNSSVEGHEMKFEDLLLLPERFHDIWEIVVVGNSNSSNATIEEENQRERENFDLYIELVDSSYWEIYSKDNKYIEQLEDRFSKIEMDD